MHLRRKSWPEGEPTEARGDAFHRPREFDDDDDDDDASFSPLNKNSARSLRFEILFCRRVANDETGNGRCSAHRTAPRIITGHARTRGRTREDGGGFLTALCSRCVVFLRVREMWGRTWSAETAAGALSPTRVLRGINCKKPEGSFIHSG